MARPLHEHPLYRFSSIARPLDPRWPSNKAILIVQALAFAAGAVWGFVQTGDWQQALVTGVSAALTAFLSWALGRELDPDLNLTAWIAVALAGLAFVGLGQADLWTLVAALGLGRVVSRTVGPPARWTDLAMILGLVAAALFVSQRWTLCLAAAVALALDALLPEGRKSRLLLAAAAIVLLPIAWSTGHLQATLPSHPFGIGVLVVASGAAILTAPAPASSCDVPGHDLHRRRLQGGMLVALLVAVLAHFEPTTTMPAPGVTACLLAMVAGRGFRRP